MNFTNDRLQREVASAQKKEIFTLKTTEITDVIGVFFKV